MQQSFIATKAYYNINQYLIHLQVSIIEEPQEGNEYINKILASTQLVLENTDLDPRPARFANYGFREFLSKIKKLVYSADPAYLYFINGFGNETRMDYGTGHELNFLCMTYVLVCEGKLKINQVFNTMKIYFRIVREMLKKFNVEPAGSIGVWGIDDYQILPFLLGSAEMIVSKVENGCYKEALDYVKMSKGKHFEKQSQILFSFEKKRWTEINNLLRRKYFEDVLSRNVVNQHFIFSKYLEKKTVEEFKFDKN